MKISALALMLCVPVAWAQEPREAVVEFERAVRKGARDAAAIERIEAATAALRGIDSRAAALALIDGYVALENAAAKVVGKRHKRLAKGGGSRELGPLRYEVQPIHDLQATLLERLSDCRSSDAVAAMVLRLFQSSAPLPMTLQLALADRVGELEGASLGWLDSVSASSDSSELLVLLRAVSNVGPRAERAAAWVVTQLAHRDAAIRVEAMRALARLASPNGIEPMIARLDTETGADREALLDALVVLTGQWPGNSSDSWNAWLRAEGQAYVQGQKALGKGDASIRTASADEKTSSGQYFGIDQNGDSILYIFDVSASMRHSMTGERALPGSRNREASSDSRWARCEKELVQAIESLPPHKTFNLIGFANELVVFSPKMVKASKRNVKRARTWIENLDLHLETNIYDALELGFRIAGRGAKDRYYPMEVDTIFFLSDGGPTIPSPPDGARGRTSSGDARPAPGRGLGPGGFLPDDTNQILAAVRRWNVLGRVVVHTIALGLNAEQPRGRGAGRPGRGRGGGQGDERSRAKRFMQRLAEQNRGRFVEHDS